MLIQGMNVMYSAVYHRLAEPDLTDCLCCYRELALMFTQISKYPQADLLIVKCNIFLKYRLD